MCTPIHLFSFFTRQLHTVSGENASIATVNGRRMGNCPDLTALQYSLSLYLPGHLDEAVVERQRMAYRVLPALLIVLVVGEVGHDPLVDFRKSKHLILAFLNGQRDQTDVAIWRLRISITTLAPDL